jgi:hypothetical protein
MVKGTHQYDITSPLTRQYIDLTDTSFLAFFCVFFLGGLIMKIFCVHFCIFFVHFLNLCVHYLHFLLSGAVCVVDLSDIDNIGDCYFVQFEFGAGSWLFVIWFLGYWYIISIYD